jgi:predicted nucleic acid-binding protein
MAFVVDTSLALKWFLADEEDRTDSLLLLRAISDANRPVVPWLWFYEIGNALTVAVRRKRIAIEQLEEILHMLEQMPFDIDPPDRIDLLRCPIWLANMV